MTTLSPSELAALLGPIVHRPVERMAAASEEMPQWDRFAAAFSHALTGRLRPLVRAAVRVQPSGCRALTAEAVNSASDSRSLVSFWQSNRSLEPLAMTLTAPLVTTFVDRLLGGRAESNLDELVEHRPLTDVDQRLVRRLIEAVRQCLIELAGPDHSLEMNDLPPHATSFAEAWLSDCSLLRLSFELRFVQGGGVLELLLPFDIANAFADAEVVSTSDESFSRPLSSEAGSQANKNVRPAEGERSQRQSRSATVVQMAVAQMAVARLARTELATSDLRSLAVGDVLLTDTAPGQPLEVLVAGRLGFHAEPGTLDGHKAVRLLSQCSK